MVDVACKHSDDQLDSDVAIVIGSNENNSILERDAEEQLYL